MASKKLLTSLILQILLATILSTQAAKNSKLFREYIGAEGNGVKFSNVPIHPGVEFHFILSFAIDYTDGAHPSPANGNFTAYWDTDNLTPSEVSVIKSRHSNVKVAMSLGGDTIHRKNVQFEPKSINSWLQNAVPSITKLVRQFNLDGIDIDYEHFDHVDPDTFAECIGQLLSNLKNQKIISFASIAPFDSDEVQPHYMALWSKYGHLIDFVNFQFYAYDKGTTIPQFLKHFETQCSNYKGGNILVSFGTDKSGGLSPKNGFFQACNTLKSQGKLNGIFIWSADDSMESGFPLEKRSQVFLAS